jgi:hypothetical protein
MNISGRDIVIYLKDALATLVRTAVRLVHNYILTLKLRFLINV